MARRTEVRVVLDQRAINSMLFSTTGASARRAAMACRSRARANLVAAGRVETGALLASINARQVRATSVLNEWSVGSDLPYAGYQEKGIGPVFARPGGVLRFKPKGSSVYIFRPRTAGFPGAHYLRNAYRSLRLSDYLP